MQRPKYVAFLLLAGAVLVGYALGFAADRASLRDRLAPRWNQHAMRTQLHDALGLTAAQRAVVDSILDRRNERREALLAPLKPQLDAIYDSARAEIRLRLTPEQQRKWDEIIAQIDKKR